MWIDGFSGFGLFTLLTNIIGYTGWKSKEAKENKKAFKRTYNPKKNTYLDMYCIERRPDGEYCKTERDSNGDLVQRNMYNEVVRNFSLEERAKEASALDATVLRMSEENLFTSSSDKPIGIRYKDKKTGEEYVIRTFRVEVSDKKAHCVYFYMRVSDATLVRITDGEKKYGTLKDMDIIEQFIETFNNKQKTKKYYLISEKYYDVKNVHKDREPQKII